MQAFFDFETRVIGNNISMLMLSSDRDSHDHHLRNYKTSDRGQYYKILVRELTGRTKDGNQFPFKLGVSEVNYAGRQ
jgi:PAS domain S-box-containing protein